MTQPPMDDEHLVDFLRQNRPIPPSTPPDLEERIMISITASSTSSSPPNVTAFPYRRLWVVPSAIVAGVLIAWGSDRFFAPTRPTAAELASLETFLENNWNGIGVENETTDLDADWFSPANPTNPSNNYRSEVTLPSYQATTYTKRR